MEDSVTETVTVLEKAEACWQQIGALGDRTCPELPAIDHCHHCSVYKAAGAKLLNRAIAPDYLQTQTARVAQVEQVKQTSVCSALVFRLGAEWLAIAAELCQQILSPVAEHTLPHRSNATLLGIVNVRGQLLLKVSLRSVLGLATNSVATDRSEEITKTQQTTQKIYQRMVVVSSLSESGVVDTWAFDVDEMYGIQSVLFDDLQPAAAGVMAATDTCTRYLFDWQDKRVSFLDNIKLFELVRAQAL